MLPGSAPCRRKPPKWGYRGRTEDAADTYAALRLIRSGSNFWHRVLIEAAEGWFLADRREAFGVWGWPRLAVISWPFFLALDVTFVSANVHKIPAGGWFPLVVGALTLTLMLSRLRGRAVAFERKEEGAVSIDAFVKRMNSLQRAAGVAVYLTTRRDVMPSALSLNLRHNRVLHELV
jgi:hypothetical protein